MPGKYKKTIRDFLNEQNETVVGTLALGVTNFELLVQQRTSWDHQITFLKSAFQNIPKDWEDWNLILEYPIPRRSKRIDIILLAKDVVFVIEFKDKEKKYTLAAISQVEDYSLDLRDFHKKSASLTLIPIVWASEAKEQPNQLFDNDDFVKPTLFANKQNLDSIIKLAFEYFTNSKNAEINSVDWDNSEYLPTPTIIEAAQHLFSGQSVREISRSHAGSENLTYTTNAVLKAISQAQVNDEKII